MQPFILWQKVDPPYIYGILSNFKKVQIGYLDSYGNKVYFASYYDYDDISEDYKPEQEPNGKNISGDQWNRYQQRMYYKNLRENLNNSSNPEYSRPQHLPNDIQFAPIHQHNHNLAQFANDKITYFQNNLKNNSRKVVAGAGDLLTSLKKNNQNKGAGNLISIVSGNLPNDNDDKRVKYSDKPWLNYEEKKFGKLNRQYGFWYQDKNNKYHYSVDDSLNEYTEEEFSKSKYGLEGGTLVLSRVTETDDRKHILVLEPNGIMSIYKQSDATDFTDEIPFLVKDYVTKENWRFDQSGYLVSGINKNNEKNLSNSNNPQSLPKENPEPNSSIVADNKNIPSNNSVNEKSQVTFKPISSIPSQIGLTDLPKSKHLNSSNYIKNYDNLIPINNLMKQQYLHGSAYSPSKYLPFTLKILTNTRNSTPLPPFQFPFNLYLYKKIQHSNGGEESWYSWNGPLMRAVVPDKFTIALGTEITGILGIGVQPITFSILTRGKESGIYYTPQVNANLGGGAFFSAGVEFTSSYFTGYPRNIKASMLSGHTYGIMANGGYLGDVSIGASFSPTDWTKREGFINGSGGIGVGVGAFGGVQYQYTIGVIPIWQWKRWF